MFPGQVPFPSSPSLPLLTLPSLPPIPKFPRSTSPTPHVPAPILITSHILHPTVGSRFSSCQRSAVSLLDVTYDKRLVHCNLSSLVLMVDGEVYPGGEDYV